jgi:diacylglycerol kinase family enzyme
VSKLSKLPITVIMNAASGHDDKQVAREEIEKVLAASGRNFRVLTPERPDELEKLAKRAVEEAGKNPGIIVAAGGDGTINTVAGAVAGTNLPFGVVPLGTFNFFARNLGIPLEAVAATQALLDGHTRPLHIARVNGKVFLINSSVGLYRRLQEEREKLEVPVASCTERGLMAMLVLRPMSRWKIVGFAVRGMLQGLNNAENMLTHCASKVTVNWRRGRKMKVAIDGETMECTLPLHYEVMRDALQVVVPRDPAPRE